VSFNCVVPFNLASSLHSKIFSMALPLYIPPCIRDPAHPLHTPPLSKPLRIQVDGLLVSIQKLLPDLIWHLDPKSPEFPQPAGPQLARLAYQAIYKQAVRDNVPGDMIVRDECLGWITDVKPWRHIVPFDLFHGGR
jgi:hypothetical protein